MTDLRDLAAGWLASREPAIVVCVVRADGSVPREAGTRMLVSLAASEGTIGGGHLELKAIERARTLLRTRAPDGGPRVPMREHFALGPSLGQCCGGAVTLEYALLDDTAMQRWPAQRPLFDLQMYGAGHVGRAIARALAALPVNVDWIDERDDVFEGLEVMPAHIRRVCVDAVVAEVDRAPVGAFYLVLTHRHDLDLRITQAITRRADFGYLGLIGSRTKRARFAHRLRTYGIAEAVVDRITCPIGVPGIDGKSPEVIAVAVVAQMLQVAHVAQRNRGAVESPDAAPAGVRGSIARV